MKRLSIQKKKN